MNTPASATIFSTESVSPKREVLMRELFALTKMASALAVPFLFVCLVWM
ncbi:hypothetical protein [Vibrio caribbeanicus]